MADYDVNRFISIPKKEIDLRKTSIMQKRIIILNRLQSAMIKETFSRKTIILRMGARICFIDVFLSMKRMQMLLKKTGMILNWY